MIRQGQLVEADKLRSNKEIKNEEHITLQVRFLQQSMKDRLTIEIVVTHREMTVVHSRDKCQLMCHRKARPF